MDVTSRGLTPWVPGSRGWVIVHDSLLVLMTALAALALTAVVLSTVEESGLLDWNTLSAFVLAPLFSALSAFLGLSVGMLRATRPATRGIRGAPDGLHVKGLFWATTTRWEKIRWAGPSRIDLGGFGLLSSLDLNEAQTREIQRFLPLG